MLHAQCYAGLWKGLTSSKAGDHKSQEPRWLGSQKGHREEAVTELWEGEVRENGCSRQREQCEERHRGRDTKAMIRDRRQ